MQHYHKLSCHHSSLAVIVSVLRLLHLEQRIAFLSGLAVDKFLPSSEFLSLLDDLLRPRFILRQRHLGRHVGKLAEVDLALSTLHILYHLKEKLYLINILDKVTF